MSRMSISVLFIQTECLFHGAACLGKGDIGRQSLRIFQEEISLGDSPVGGSVIWVNGHRALEVPQSRPMVPHTPEILPFQIFLVGFGGDGAQRAELHLGRRRSAQMSSNICYHPYLK